MTTEAPKSPPTCVVCAEIVLAPFEAWCMRCGLAFHLQQRVDIPGKDCGDVWIDEDSLGLDFACLTCIERDAAENEPPPVVEPIGLDDVLDLGEAAASVDWTEQDLAAAADAGRVKFRRTAGGILLFLRRDLLALTGGHS